MAADEVSLRAYAPILSSGTVNSPLTCKVIHSKLGQQFPILFPKMISAYFGGARIFFFVFVCLFVFWVVGGGGG